MTYAEGEDCERAEALGLLLLGCRAELLAIVLAPEDLWAAVGEAPVEGAAVGAVDFAVFAGAAGAGMSEDAADGGGLSCGAGEGAIAIAALIIWMEGDSAGGMIIVRERASAHWRRSQAPDTFGSRELIWRGWAQVVVWAQVLGSTG